MFQLQHDHFKFPKLKLKNLFIKFFQSIDDNKPIGFENMNSEKSNFLLKLQEIISKNATHTLFMINKISYF